MNETQQIMSDPMEINLTEREFADFQALIFQEAGISLSDAKRNLVASRLLKRLRHYNFDSYGQYYNFVTRGEHDGSELIEMINRITTNKTDFFRENHHFEFLQKELLPALEARAQRTGDRKVRIWSAACSSGEEPYSIAMVLREYFSNKSGWDLRILASDIDSEIIEKAENGVYDFDRFADVSQTRMKRFFETVDSQYARLFKAKDELKEIITFRRINFVDYPWPINTQFDAIFCRNVMIYFNDQTQDELVSRFSDFIKPDGHLIIGHSENLTRVGHLYKALGNTVYKLTQPAGLRKFDDSSASKPFKSDVSAPKPTLPPTASAKPMAPSAQQSGSSSVVAPQPATDSTRQPTMLQFAKQLDSSIPTKPIIVGEVKASREPLCVTTLLGSCVAACLYDPINQVGGMNHFMLPESGGRVAGCPTLGVHAMELLINEIMKLGGDRRRLEAKVFGGGAVVNSLQKTSMIGQKNIDFILNFLDQENIPIKGQHLGGSQGRRVAFYTQRQSVRRMSGAQQP
ncbi:MAG: CheR family methyltransferase [Pirellulaceae bacterium]